MTIATTRRRLLGWLGLVPAAAAVGRTATAAPTKALAPPTARAPVRVLFARVAGEAYYDMADSLVTLTEGDPVVLRREPTNPYDRRAIQVFDITGLKLGYLARVDNSAVARMMDAGERFAARVARINVHTRDVRLSVDWLPG